MDKTIVTLSNTKKRRGFALIITLSVLTVLISLTVVLLSYFSKVQRDASDTTAMIQANVYYANILKKFKAIGHKNVTSLYRYTSTMSSPDGRFRMSISCTPLSKGANINWLKFENNQELQEQYTFVQTIFDDLAQAYDLEDRDRLQEMLLEEIGGKKKFVKKEFSRLRQKNGIISYKQFAQIVSRYQLEVDDLKVGRIPWSKYFSFSSEAKVIDAEYSSSELLSILFDIDLATVKEWQGSRPKLSLQSFVNENNPGAYTARKKLIAGTGKNFLEESICTVRYKNAGRQYKFRFDYIHGEAKHFEFYDK
jgi:type II secretory pathway pseudopilin PulG